MNESYWTMLKSKIHRATITDANVDYYGSIGIDSELMQKAGILPNEKVHVLNVSNGERLETYVMELPAGSGQVVMNGAAAHQIGKGELVIVLTYASVPESEAPRTRPTTVFVDAENRIKKVSSD